MLKFARFSVFVFGLCAVCSIIQPVGASTPSARSLVASALRNALAGGAVHEVTVTKRSGETLTMVNDIGTNEGRQLVKLSDGSFGDVIAFDSQDRAFVKGNETGLENYFRFPPSDAEKFAEKWMEAVPSDEAWPNIVGSTTLTSDFETNLRIDDPKLSNRVTSINGTRAFMISGKGALSAGVTTSVRLYISDNGRPLPVRLIEKAKGVTATVTWSKWGEDLHLDAPTKYVPLP